MKRQDALRLEADARDMVEALPEGVSVPWHACIKVRYYRGVVGTEVEEDTPEWRFFQINTSDLGVWEEGQLALGIVGGKPVFVGDVLYYKASGRKVEVFQKAGLKGSLAATTLDVNKSVITGMLHEFTWVPPEQTITFEKRTLPMPDNVLVTLVPTEKGYPLTLTFRTKESATEWYDLLVQRLEESHV